MEYQCPQNTNYHIEGENVLHTQKHILICFDDELMNCPGIFCQEYQNIKKNFCGIVSNMDHIANIIFKSDIIIYLCGRIEQNYEKIITLPHKIIYVIKEISYAYNTKCSDYNIIKIGEVPLNINNVGVYIRDFFPSNIEHYKEIKNSHEFQKLRESSKPTKALREGIYLSNVTLINDEISLQNRKINENINETETIGFNLLRCSTNLDGPTLNFGQIDHKILDQVNSFAESFFEQKIHFNHVLAQIYYNTPYGGKNKNSEKKAKISQHSDKTKDMPENALIAFCTFMENYYDDKFHEMKYKRSKEDYFDHCFNEVSVLTKMRFKLKKNHMNLPKDFTITLYPNSLFIIPLSMNRLYTHEIVPSSLPIDKIPTRMGYIPRCSKTKAIYSNNQTYIMTENGDYIPLQPADEEGSNKLKIKYKEENSLNTRIQYMFIPFSFNYGDYMKPCIQPNTININVPNYTK